MAAIPNTHEETARKTLDFFIQWSAFTSKAINFRWFNIPTLLEVFGFASPTLLQGVWIYASAYA
jgi:hypothetical protein